MKRILRIDLFFFVTFLGVCIFILLQSPLAPYAKSSNGVDSSVYIYSAQHILDGQLMYKDIVDHKGPFLYLIEVAALFIFGGNWIGIWIFELLSLFISSVFMYKTARFFADKVSSFFAVITGILSLSTLLIGGNLTEEWSLPYISIALYIFVAYMKENKPLTMIRLLILSLTFVLTFMIRANLVAIWGSFGIALLIKWMAEKKYKELIRNLSFILLFLLLFLMPFFLYFYSKGILNNAVYLVFKYNIFEYQPKSSLYILLSSFQILLDKGVYLSIIPIIITVYMFSRNKTIFTGGILLSFILTAFTCALGYKFEHYFIVFAPILVVPYAYLLALIKGSIPKAKYISLFILFILYNFTSIKTQAWIIHQNYSEQGYGLFTIPPPTMKKLKEVIIQNTNGEDKILVKGNQAAVYLYSGRTCATRFPYPILNSSLAEKYYVTDAEKALPKLIIQGNIVNSWRNSFRLDSLLTNRYQLVATDIKDVEIWKLKE